VSDSLKRVVGIGLLIFGTIYSGAALGPKLLLAMKLVGTVLLSSGAKKIKGALQSFGTELQLSGDPTDVRSIVYGETWTGGTLRYRNSTGVDNRELYMVVVLAGHSCDSVPQVVADKESLAIDGSGNVTSPVKWAGLMNIRFYLGSDTQTVDTTLDTAFANWTSNHRLRGLTYAIVKLTFDETNLNTVPQFRFKVRGRKVYDNRLDSTNGGSGSHRLNDETTWAWSENAVNCCYDYARGVMINGIRIAGPGISSTRVDPANIIAEANVCDENVAIAAGGNGNRYTVNGVIDPRQPSEEIIKLFESAFGGEFLWSDNKWRFFVGAYRTPTLALTADHFIGPLKHVVHMGEAARYDTIQGRYSSSAEQGGLVDYSPVSLPTATVGSERIASLDFQLVNDIMDGGGTDGGARAQRIAKLELEKRAAGKRISCTTSLYGFRAMPGETISVTHAAFGLSAQAMRVMEVQLRPVFDGEKSGLVVDLVLEAGPSSLYTWAAEETAIGASPTLPQAQVPIESPLGWTPVLVNVARAGSTFTKTDGTGYTASVYSTERYPACVVSTRGPNTTNLGVFVGLSVTPTTNHSYETIDFMWGYDNDGVLRIYELGVYEAFGTYSGSGDPVSIEYDGHTVRYYRGAALIRSTPREGAYLHLDSSFAGAGVVLNQLTFAEGALQVPSGNLLRVDGWAVGDVPSAGRGNFVPVETATNETQVLISTGPHGISQMAWEASCTDPGFGSGGDANGGWDNRADLKGLNPAKAYRSTVWARRRVSTGGTNGFYHGCGQVSDTYDLGGGVNNNPYFVAGTIVSTALPVIDRWYLCVGVIHGSSYAGSNSGVAGIYDPTTGQKVLAANEFRMAPTATTQSHRTFMYYGGDTTVRIEWTEPRFEEINGNEPALSALLTSGNALDWRREMVHDEFAYVNDVDLLMHWGDVSGGGEITAIADTTAPGGNAVRFGNNSGNDQRWIWFKDYLFPYDGLSLYEVGCVVSRSAGTGTFYCGLEGVSSDRVTMIAADGTNNHSSQHYLAAAGANPSASWQTYRGFVRGWGTSGLGAAANDPRVPSKMYSGAVFVRPLLIMNYSAAAGQTEVAALWVRRIPGEQAGLDTDVYRQSLAPAHAIGRLWVDTDDARVYRSDGSAWIQISANDLAVIAGAINLATQVSGTLTAAFAAAGLINANVTINADGSLTGAGGGQASLNSIPGDIATTQIEDNAITTGKINANAVTAAKIAANTITAAQIAALTITAAEIAANTITAAKITALTITAAEIAASTITAGKLSVSTLSAITADLGAITAGTIDLSSGTAYIKSGQTAYDAGTGFWLERNGGTPRFSIGNSAGNKLTWNGTALVIVGDISANNVLTMVNAPSEASADKTVNKLLLKGDSNTHAVVGQLLGSAVATVNNLGAEEWTTLRTFVTNFTGTFRLMVEARENVTGADSANGGWRLLNGVDTNVHEQTISSGTYAQTFSGEETVTSSGETWEIQGVSRTDLSTYTIETEIRDIEVRCRFNHAPIT
jgi:hypothetical protein